MKKMLKPAIVLACICASAAVLLALINNVTQPRITAYENSVLMSALERVANGNEIGEYEAVEDNQYVVYRYRLSENGKTSGYLLGLVTSGYGGEMTVAASFATDGAVMAAELVSDSETPGVGKKAEAEGYMDKFIGTGTVSNPVPESKADLSSADSASVSGATMTFTGIIKALAAGSAYVRSLGGN